MSGIFLEPIGLIYGPTASEAISLGAALPLAGSSWIAFSGVRLWEGEPGNLKHAIARTATIQAIEEPRVKELLDRIVTARPPLAGVSLERPRIMGVVNVTPDSFSDGGETLESAAAVERATSLAAEGAAFIDVGAESTRPGADGISPSEELARLMPVLSGLKDLAVPASVDTRKPAVMRAAVEAGAAMINDISALAYDATSVETAVALSVPVVLMHAQGEPKTMQDNPAYKDVTIEVYEWLERRIEAVEAAGLPRDRILADPGIGFGKTAAHNLTLLRTLGLFHGLGVPLIVGTSRKNFLGRITGEKTPKGRVSESVTTAIAVAAQGVQVLRVHDVDATNRAFSVWLALHRGVETAI